MPDPKVYCLLINHEKADLPGGVFNVDAPHGVSVYDLKEKVKEKRAVDLQHVDAARLTVWRCTDPKLVISMDEDELKKALSNVNFADKGKVKKPGGGQSISALNLAGDEILLIEVPGALCFFLFSR